MPLRGKNGDELLLYHDSLDALLAFIGRDDYEVDTGGDVRYVQLEVVCTCRALGERAAINNLLA